MLCFTQKDPELACLFLSHTLRYYVHSLRARNLPEFVDELEHRLGISGLSRSGEGTPVGYIGTADEPEIHPIY